MSDTYFDVRWQCFCGRFIPQAAVTTTDYPHPSAYYGLRTEWAYECSRCGTMEGQPRCTEVKEHKYTDGPSELLTTEGDN